MICNSASVHRHLIEGFHLPTQENKAGWERVDYNCAKFNFENPKNRKTAFRRYTTWSKVEELILATILSSSSFKYTQEDGRLVAINTFHTTVGQQAKFQNGVNQVDGYVRADTNTLKVVYDHFNPTRGHSQPEQHLFIIITAFPI